MNKYCRLIMAWWRHSKSRLGDYLYIGMALFSIAGGCFFFSSYMLFVDDSAIIDTGLGLASQQQIGDAKVQMVQRKINGQAGYGELLFEVDEETSQPIGQKYLAVIGQVTRDGQHKKQLPSHLKKVSEHYYVLQFSQITARWQHLIIDFGQQDKTHLIAGKDYDTLLKKDGQQATTPTPKISQKAFRIDYRKTGVSHVTHPQKKAVYLAEGLRLDLASNAQKIKTIKADLAHGQQQVKSMQVKIKALKADEAYQTDADIKDAESQITSIKTDITSTQKTIKKAKEALEVLYAQQANLRAKLRQLVH